jgi:hypothetical protein
VQRATLEDRFIAAMQRERASTEVAA